MIANEKKTASSAVVIFVTSATVLIRISIFLSDKILLLWIYGWHRLVTEHLAIIKEKPNIIVSNGDVLYGKGFPHYLIGVSIWLPSTVAFLLLIFRLLPDQEREALERGLHGLRLHPADCDCLIFCCRATPIGI